MNKKLASYLLAGFIAAGGISMYFITNSPDNAEPNQEVVNETKELDFSKLSPEEQERLSAEATIPDKDFRSFLNHYLGKGSGNFNPITVGELESATTDFIMNSTVVYDITGIEHLKNVKRMDLSENAFTSMEPLSKLDNLESLIVSANNLSNVDFLKNMKKLKFLDIGYNQIESIEPLRNLNNLDSLYMYQTQVTDITPIADKEYLANLFLQETPVKSLSTLETLPNLKVLGLHNTPEVENLDSISKLTKLEELSLTKMGLTDITMLKDLANLKLAYLNGNKIKDITALKDKILLEELDISDNQVEDISPLTNSKNLQMFIATQNKIKSVEALKGKSKMLTLYIDNNDISDWSPLQGAFPDIESLMAEGNPAEVRQIEFYNGKPVMKSVSSEEVAKSVMRISVYVANSKKPVEITDKKVISEIMAGLSKAQSMTEPVDIDDPEFNFNVLFVDGTIQGVNLWLGDKSDNNVGLITDKSNKELGYTLPLEETNTIRNHILEALNK